MRSGRLEQASAISDQIGPAISAYNAGRLAGAAFVGGDGREDVSLMWRLVNEVTRGRHCNIDSPPPSLTAECINRHYAHVSTDPCYTPPIHKLTCSPSPPSLLFLAPWVVHRLLSTSKTNAMGCDGVPPWFSRLVSPFISGTLAYLYSLSLSQSTIPAQWKCATITPVPKIPSPLTPADLRPISVLPLFSTVLEKIIIRNFIYPKFTSPPLSLLLADQHAFRPSGSTTAAVVSLVHTVTSHLATEPFVHVLALDFSKAFDVTRHSTLFTKIADVPLPDHVYEWLISFFTARSHIVRFNSQSSSPLPINASVVQGSVLGPALFVINTSDIRCMQFLPKICRRLDTRRSCL